MIRFNQPRYILPLIILPFIYVFYYLFDLSEKEDKVQEVEIASINPTLPDPFLDEDNLKDKFDAFQEAYKNNRKSSAIREIDRREENVMHSRQTFADEPIPVIPAEPIIRKTAYVQPKRKKELDSYEAQMKLFKAQMQYVDSLIQVEEEGNEEVISKAHPPKRGSLELVEVGSQKPEVRSTEEQIIKAASEFADQFNTISKQENNQFIRAVIDEEIKVTKSSRVRLRLLEDVKIGQHSLSEGQFLFGVVHAFKPQRVEIGINSIINNGKMLDISLEIYDLDGMKGLYIPESKYRELTKEVGENLTSNQQMPIEPSDNQQMQVITALAKDAFNTAARTASKTIRKQKALLKYNTHVYLINKSN